MRRRATLGIVLGIITVLVGLLTGVAYAASSDQVVQGTTDHTLFEAGTTVTITGTVNGDVLCAGQNITVSATVNGDVLCVGQTITVDGTVTGNVRLAGQAINLGASVARNASLAGQDIVIEDRAAVGRDATIAGQTVAIDGRVARDIFAAGDTVGLNGFIGRDLTAYVRALSLNAGTHVTGAITYTGQQQLRREPGSVVGGIITYHHASVRHASASSFVLFKLFWLVAMVVFGVVLVALFPQLFRRWNVRWGAGFWWSILIGFIAMIAVPIVIIVLFASIIGAPLGFMLLLLWIVAAMISVPLAAYFIGSLVAPRLHPVLLILLGAVLLGIVELIPVLGWIIGVIAYWLGTGMLIRGIKAIYQRPQYVLNKSKTTIAVKEAT